MLKSNSVKGGPAASRAAAFNAALRRGLLLTIALCLLGAVAGGLYGARASTEETASATILVNPLNGNPFSTTGSGDDLKNLQTEAQLVQSDDVARLVQAREGKSTPLPTLLSGLEVEVPPNTQILQIAYSARNPTTALTRAQWFAEEYLKYREQRAKTLVESQTKRLNEQLTARTKEQQDLAKRSARERPNTPEANVTRVQLEAVSTQINQLRARTAELQSVSSNPGQLVTPAAIPAAGLFQSWIVFALAGLLAGLVLAVVIALLRSRADNRIRHVDDVASAGQILLGSVSGGDVVTARELFETAGPGAQLPDAFKNLRVSLLTTEHRRPAVIVVTTAQHSEDPPSSIAGLALATSTSNLSTIVIEAIDAQLSLPERVEQSPGLAEVLSGQVPVADAVVPVRPHLQVLGNDGRLSVDDLFMAPEMHQLIGNLRGSADIIFVVTSNVHDPRSKALIDIADSVILEVVQGVSSYRDLYQASNDYTQVAEKLLGVVYVSAGGRRRAQGSEKRKPTGATAVPDWDGRDRPAGTASTNGNHPDASVADLEGVTAGGRGGPRGSQPAPPSDGG
jgi:capsular polysaccharide biosynthesis protein